MNRATLQQICLGVGILAGDAHFIQFTEEGSVRGAAYNLLALEV